MKELIRLNGEKDLNGIKIKIIEGGFGEGNKAMLFSDIALKHEVEPKYINKLIVSNINRYTKDDIIDLCEENFKVHAKNLGFITSNGQKHCYILSERGYIKLVSSMANDNNKKWEVMDEIINNYFRMREVIKNDDRLKADLLLSIYKGGQEGILASKQLSDMEVAEAIAPLNKQIEQDSPFVALAKERIAKGEKISLTDATKSLGLKRGQISTYFKQNGYLHKTQTEVNEKGKELFGIYKEGHFNCIGILEKGIDFINEHLEEIKKAPTRLSK